VILDFADEEVVVQTRFATAVLALARSWLGDDIERAASAVEASAALPLPVDPGRFSHFVFLGAGWTTGLAHEAALKLRESAGVWAESYPAMEYRHGPVSAATDATLVWTLGAVDRSVLDAVAATSATVRDAGGDPLAELVVVQRFAVALALRRGRDPNSPLHLTRSVVLT
jgi:glucosamine--fructose-6-phosphate aminotransferase (isomerizing)